MFDLIWKTEPLLYRSGSRQYRSDRSGTDTVWRRNTQRTCEWRKGVTTRARSVPSQASEASSGPRRGHRLSKKPVSWSRLEWRSSTWLPKTRTSMAWTGVQISEYLLANTLVEAPRNLFVVKVQFADSLLQEIVCFYYMPWDLFLDLIIQRPVSSVPIRCSATVFKIKSSTFLDTLIQNKKK